MTDLREAAKQALEALHEIGWSNDTRWQSDRAATVIPALRAALAKPDLDRCPRCGGPADNGHDREVPPNPYYCTKCMAEPKPLTDEEIEGINRDLPLLHMQAKRGSVAVVFARAVERAHGICAYPNCVGGEAGTHCHPIPACFWSTGGAL